MFKVSFQLLLFRFNSFFRFFIRTVFVTALSLNAFAHGEIFQCRSVFIEPARDQKRILDLLSRLDDLLAKDAKLILKVPKEESLSALKKLYSKLSTIGQHWSVQQSLSDAEAFHIRSQVKRGFEIIRNADNYELNLYRRNELMDISYRLEKLIAETVADQLLDPDAEKYEENLAVISSALMEFNSLSLASPFSIDAALVNYKVFSSDQIQALLSLQQDAPGGGARYFGENSRRLKAVGFSNSEIFSLLRVVLEQKSTSACCGRGCRSCPKSIGLRRSIQDRISRPSP